MSIQSTMAFEPGTDTPPPPNGRTKSANKKVAAILRLFFYGERMNRFEAERHHDHCLNSTVSTLQNGYGIKIERVTEVVPCVRNQRTTPCKRYWLLRTPENLSAARSLLVAWGCL